jgi:hypothetical protein
MRFKLFFLSVSLFSQLSMAAYFTPQELEKVPKCSKDYCFGQDGGASFLRYCDYAHPPIMPGTIAAYGPMSSPQGQCYCPCTFDYLSGARRD